MVSSRLKMVLTEDELKRVTVQEKPNNGIRIIVDVHGMKCYLVRRFINNIINVAMTAFQLVIIHGFNHGTAIKSMLEQDFSNRRIFEQYSDPFNRGVTHMKIAA